MQSRIFVRFLKNISLFIVSFFFLNNTYASGPWNFGVFSSAGTFSSAYEACEWYSRDWASRKSVIYDKFELNYSSGLSWGVFGATGATCKPFGRRGSVISTDIAVGLAYRSDSSFDPFDPNQCDLFFGDGSCYVQNSGYNLGQPLVVQASSCGDKHGPSTGVGNPINLATGNKYQQELDVTFSGDFTSLALMRHYNSYNKNVGLFGKGWSSDFTSHLKEVSVYATAASTASTKPKKHCVL